MCQLAYQGRVTRCEVVRLKPFRPNKMVPFEAKLVKSGQVDTGSVAMAHIQCLLVCNCRHMALADAGNLSNQVCQFTYNVDIFDLVCQWHACLELPAAEST